jgi:hypothetical protein
MLALTPVGSLNALSCLHYRMELGNDSVYMINTRNEEIKTISAEKTPTRRWQVLFGKDISLFDLNKKLTDGWEIDCTEITEKNSWQQYQEMHEGNSVVLFAIEQDGKLQVFTEIQKYTPSNGWKVISLVNRRFRTDQS